MSPPFLILTRRVHRRVNTNHRQIETVQPVDKVSRATHTHLAFLHMLGQLLLTIVLKMGTNPCCIVVHVSVLDVVGEEAFIVCHMLILMLSSICSSISLSMSKRSAIAGLSLRSAIGGMSLRRAIGGISVLVLM